VRCGYPGCTQPQGLARVRCPRAPFSRVEASALKHVAADGLRGPTPLLRLQSDERLVALMGQYLPPNPDKIKAALPTAQITPPAGGDAKIAFNNYLKQGDTMALSVNSQSKKLDQISIQSSLDNDPVSFLVDFARLPDGTNYPSMTSIKSPSKSLEIKVTTSDYHK